MIQKLQIPSKAASLFLGWEETMIWSALQGIMGEVYANDDVTSAAVVSGDFCFFGGTPDRELVERFLGVPFIIATPQDDVWGRLIEAVHGIHASPKIRYALQKNRDGFDITYLQKLAASLPEGYVLRSIDEKLYECCNLESWSRDLVAQYPTYEIYKRLGLGIAVLHGGGLVAGASSYCTYREGIEIEIDTRADHRRKGLAAACGAALILECLKRGLFPSWDAQNLWSVALAEKLRYRFSHTYPVYELTY